MRRRTRHLLILIGVPLLLTLAVGGWLVDSARKPLAVLRPRRRPRPLRSANAPPVLR